MKSKYNNKEARNKVVDDGERRQRIHGNQDNIGNKKNPPAKNMNGEPIR